MAYIFRFIKGVCDYIGCTPNGEGKTGFINSKRCANVFIHQQIFLHFTFAASNKEPSGGDTPGDTGHGTMSVENKSELVAKLTPLQFHITQEAGTERPFTGKYNKFYEQGTYICVVCSQELFSSDTKYDSGCGWPAFNDVLDKGKVTLHADGSLAGKEYI